MITKYNIYGVHTKNWNNNNNRDKLNQSHEFLKECFIKVTTSHKKLVSTKKNTSKYNG